MMHQLSTQQLYSIHVVITGCAGALGYWFAGNIGLGFVIIAGAIVRDLFIYKRPLKEVAIGIAIIGTLIALTRFFLPKF